MIKAPSVIALYAGLGWDEHLDLQRRTRDAFVLEMMACAWFPRHEARDASLHETMAEIDDHFVAIRAAEPYQEPRRAPARRQRPCALPS